MAFEFDFTDELKDILLTLNKKDPKKAAIIYKKVQEIIISDEESIQRYKNLRHDMSDRKRVHIDRSFVLTFRVDRAKKFVLFIDVDHHDNIYRKR